MEREIQQQTERSERQPEATQTQGPDLDRESLSRMDASRFAGSQVNQYLGNLEITGQNQTPSRPGDYCPVIPNNPAELGRQLARTPDTEMRLYGPEIQMRERFNPGLVERTNDFMRRQGIPRHIAQNPDGSTRVGPAMVDVGARRRQGQRWW